VVFLGIKENIQEAKRQIENARLRGKKQQNVKLIVVTKERSVSQIKEVLECGQIALGENKAQELEEKAPQLSGVEWHFVGHLQSNKARPVVELCEFIHSVDSIKLLQKINSTAREFDKVQKVLLEVNVSNEETKFGFREDELPPVLDTLKQLPFGHLRIMGLMTMAPLVEPEKTRHFFRKLFFLSQELHLKELSMGMSNDFEVAVEEGATMVRIGTRIFE